MWHKYVHIAVLNHNTSYHSSIGCEPSRVFHGRIPYNVLDLKLGIRPQRANDSESNAAQDVLEQTKLIHEDAHKNAMQAYLEYKAYYDKKANASILKENAYVYILQPKANQQGNKIPFTYFRWIGPYILVSVLPNNNYVSSIGYCGFTSRVFNPPDKSAKPYRSLDASHSHRSPYGRSLTYYCLALQASLNFCSCAACLF